jgi:hypothetical protein
MAAAATIALPATAVGASTSTDVALLANAEGVVVNSLNHYQNTAAWRSSFRAAEAAQAALLAKVNAELSGPNLVFRQTGNGDTTTYRFTIPPTTPAWQVNWSDNCVDDFFGVNLAGPGAQNVDSGSDATSETNHGHGILHVYGAGTFDLEIVTDCSWSVQVWD